MIKEKIAATIQKKFYYGWIIIALAAISMFFSSPGQTYSISTFIDAYILDFGFSRTMISSIYSMATVLSGLLLVFVGKAVDKHGPRRILVLVGIALAGAALFNSLIQGAIMMFFGFFMMRYLGQGSLTLIPGALVPQWFEKRRAFAISLMITGTLLGNLLVPALNIAVIKAYGWQSAWLVWTALALVVFVPLMAIFVINKPEDIGLLPDNKKISNSDILEDELVKMERNSFTLQEAIKTKEFWLIGLISMIMPFVNTGLMFHFFSIMKMQTIENQAASFVIGLVALPGFIMPLIAGTIIDRYRSKFIVMTTLIVITLDFLFLNYVKSIFAAAIFMIILGLANNIQGITLNIIWVKYFGRKYLGSIRGAAAVFGVIGSALGPLPFGLSYDLTGSYKTIIIITAMLTFTGMMMAASIQKPTKPTKSRH